MNLSHEPVLTAAGIGALVSAVLVLMVRFGLPLSTDQQEAIITVVTLVAPLLIAAWIARSKVVPVSKIEAVPVAARALEKAEAAKSPG